MVKPKRRRKLDNPYTLDYIENKNIYIISFKNNKNNIQHVEVSKEIYDAFNQFELDDLKELNEYDNHIEHSEIFDNNLYTRAKYKPMSLEDSIIQQDTFRKLKDAIDQLSDIQKRRIKMYYFEDKTLREIAEIEHCKIMSVKNSIDVGIKKIKKILNFDLKNWL